MKPLFKEISCQPSWIIENDQIHLSITQLGGHMAPVIFYKNSKTPVQPYYISPWHNENQKISEPVLVPLRGDFFCLPFGENETPYKGKKFNVHGEPAGQKWNLLGAYKKKTITTIALGIKTKIATGKITKRLSIVDGQNVIYCQHVLEGFNLTTPLGHHQTLAMPDKPQSVYLSTSPTCFAMTSPVPAGTPPTGSYYAMMPNKKIASISKVPLIFEDKPFANYSILPQNEGYNDILAICANPNIDIAWTAAVFETEGFLWFSVKDPAVLPTTVFWIANKGRHTPPWNGRNHCLGLEDVCGFAAAGIDNSTKPNAMTKAGIKTAHKLMPQQPMAINLIQGVVKTPPDFHKVRSVLFKNNRAVFTSIAGKKVAIDVNYDFVKTGVL